MSSINQDKLKQKIKDTIEDKRILQEKCGLIIEQIEIFHNELHKAFAEIKPAIDQSTQNRLFDFDGYTKAKYTLYIGAVFHINFIPADIAESPDKLEHIRSLMEKSIQNINEWAEQ